jgi:CheY-like chemotaxis protein
MPKTVLIVEDDEDMRSIYRSTLARRGYRVLVATQGAEGVHLARRYRPDLILLDLRMPVMDGRGAAFYLRSDPETQDIPICVISAFPQEGSEQPGSEAIQFDCFLTKPVDPKEIVARVEELIGPSGEDPLEGESR